MASRLHRINMWAFEQEGGRLELLVHSNEKGYYGIIENVFVEEEYRKKGVATRLIEEAKEKAELLDLYKIILTCSKDLVDFYKCRGFEWQENGQAYCMRIDCE